jgi:hypothetical protein
MSGALLRKLLLDGAPLTDQVNRRHRLPCDSASALSRPTKSSSSKTTRSSGQSRTRSTRTAPWRMPRLTPHEISSLPGGSWASTGPGSRFGT